MTMPQRWLEDASSGSSSSGGRRFSIKDVYYQLDFVAKGALYNKPAPEPWISFAFGGFFALIVMIYYFSRLIRLRRSLMRTKKSSFVASGVLTPPPPAFSGSLLLRAMISAYIDCDDPIFVVVKMAAQSLLFLGGLQYDYQFTYGIMLIFYCLESCLDSLRIVIAIREVDSLGRLTVTGTPLKSEIRRASAELTPKNVYEDISRPKFLVLMVFATQSILIAFVVVDIYKSVTHVCPDGTEGCPVTGTLGSWSFYLLGIFMACVVMLGPKTSYGQSEQNPAYWLQIFLAAKQRGATCSWYDPVHDRRRHRTLRPGSWNLWIRFLMSFLINGMGFHILIHALPIQIAAQSSLTGVVFRAVGMIYLVDMDDSPGYTLTLIEGPMMTEDTDTDDYDSEAAVKGRRHKEARYRDDDDGDTLGGGYNLMGTVAKTGDGGVASAKEVSMGAQMIIKEARAKLDALLMESTANGRQSPTPTTAAPAVVAATSSAVSTTAMSVVSSSSTAFGAAAPLSSALAMNAPGVARIWEQAI